jgi:hypothetical protein
MAESAEQRKARHERYKQKLAANPEAYAAFRERGNEAKRRYNANQKLRAGSGPIGKGKPGRIVSLCGWMGW